MKQINVKFYNNNINNFNSLTLGKVKSHNTRLRTFVTNT